MKNALAGIVALVVAACLAASCGGSISTSNGGPSSDAGNQDGTLGSGGSNKADAISDSSANDVMVDSEGDGGGADVVADAPSGSDVGDAGGVDGVADSAAEGGAVCVPGSFQCIDMGSGAQYEWCNATGQWDICWCSSGPCGAPQCSVQCSCRPGATQCSGNGVQTCSASGQWGTAIACVNSACVSGKCVGVCVPGSTMCSSDAGVQTCDSIGQWSSSTACGCGYDCVSASCIGVCAPGSTQCSGNGVETCGAGAGCGAWGQAVPCVNQTCVAGACQGVCAPGQTACSDGGVETCTANGTWRSAAPCDGGACDGGNACPADGGQSE
jgi:hypothetical protein